MLAVLSVRFTDQPQRWAAVPALLMGMGGLLLVVFGSSVDRVLNWVWPPVMLAAAIWMIVCVRWRLRSRGARWLLYPVIVLLGLAAIGAGYQTSAVAALALYGALQAEDGVANKQADLAWLSAPDAEKAARFASAEAVRWVEWGLRSYHDFTLGLAVLLFAAAVARTAGVPRPIAYLMGLSGLACLVQGWVVGSDGFSGTHSTLIVVTWVLSVAWMIWLVVVAWRMQESQPHRVAR